MVTIIVMENGAVQDHEKEFPWQHGAVGESVE